MLEFYWGCLITGILFTLLTVIFDDFLGNALENVLDALTFDLPGIFQTTVIMSGLTAFGGAGIILTSYTNIPKLLVLFLSFGVAIVLSAAFYFFYVKPMENTENSTGFSMQDLVGKVGEVSVPIPINGYGEVMLSIGGSSSNQIAASFDQVEIATGTKVLIIEISDDTLLVSPYDQL
ncbi:NfeD family protein [Bacillus salitolerans]|uniref:NfeD family protein n=1 Tax=Bacillus salitolerans TaxID=1437434 RepID=A0ABW4LVQ2_9BACI